MLRDYEGFDALGLVGNIVYRGFFYGGNSPQLSPSGRFGTDCFHEADNSCYFYKTYDPQPTWIIGWAARHDNPASGQRVFTLYDEDGGASQVSIVMAAGPYYQLRRGSNTGTVLGTGTSFLIHPGVYHYLELKVTIDNTVGAAELRVNTVPEITLSGIDTQNTANAYAARPWWGSWNGGNSRFYYDDVYVLDGQAGLNDFLGDVRVSNIRPSGNGNSSQFTGSDGNSTDNYLLVDEYQPDTSDYVTDGTVGHKDTYAFGDLPTTAGTVHAVRPRLGAYKDDSGTRKIASVARLSGTEADSADFSLGAGFDFYTDIRETKPGGGSWSIADVNNAEFGPKVTA